MHFLLLYTLLVGISMGAFGGVLLGQLMERLLASNPLACVLRAYSELFADILHLCATGRLRPGR